MTATPAARTCARCGRRIEWRKKWSRDWEQVRYCSAACRRQRLCETDHQLEQAILDLLAARPNGATICPSEAARSVLGPGSEWQDLMEPARQAARRLVATGRIDITQGGHVVDPSTARGPIRLRLVNHG
jgi:hypothetical protein